MTIYQLDDRIPKVDPTAFIHPAASIIGKVTIGAECFVAPGAVVRGDYGTIVIGDKTAIEDNVVVHARPDEKCTIGNNVTLGHGCVVHNANLHDHCIVGMNAVVTDYSVLGEWAVVAEGAVVKKGQEIPPSALAFGVPARIKEDFIGEKYMEQWGNYKKIYASLCDKYKHKLIEME